MSEQASPTASQLELARRCQRGMEQAQRHYRFHVARALAAPLLGTGESQELYPLQRDGLLLAQRLALVESDFAEAKRWGEALVQLHARQSNPELRKQAYAEPNRQWRLELGACPDAAALARLELRQPPSEALPVLLAALEREPQATSLAFALLLVLRRGGLLERSATMPEAASGPNQDLIPRRFWLLRRHGTTSPTLEQRQARWQELHPGWELQWLDLQPEAIEAMEALPELVRQCCLCVGDAAVRGDLLRLALLWLHGGVAVDVGIAPQSSLAPLLTGQELLLLQDRFGGIDTGVWASPARHPWVEAALLQACRNVIEGQGYSRWDLTGSCLLSGVTARWLWRQLCSRPRQQNPDGPSPPRLLPPITILAAAEQGMWLQFGAPEPAPEGFVVPAATPLLDRRRCSWLTRRWGQDLPPLELCTNWQQLARLAKTEGYRHADDDSGPVAAASLAAWLLQQPSSALQEQLASLLGHLPSWRELFPLQEAAPVASVDAPPALDACQQKEAGRQCELHQMSFVWLPLAGQLQRTLEAIQASGRTAWIVDAGSHSGRSARWLAEHWPQAQVVCLVQRQADIQLVAHTLSGTNVYWLAARPLAGDRLKAEIEGPGALGFPLGQLRPFVETHGGEPLLLHLDAAMEGFAELFAHQGDWLACFPVVLLHGSLNCNAQGRLLPQPHHQALAAAGFELVRSGEVLVAFQRHLLRPAPALHQEQVPQANAIASGTELEEHLCVEGGVVGFDADWQGPAITEQWAFQLARQRLSEHSGLVYLGFPWASLIDHLNNGTARGRTLLLQLQALLPRLAGRKRRVTVCQQIFFEPYRWLFELAGITDLFWPHATIYSSLPGLTIHPFPLYPVHWQTTAEPDSERDILYSFIGARSTRLYLSNSRDLILSSLRGLPGSLIEGYDGWYYDDHVYGVQIRGSLAADAPQVVGEERRQRERHYVDVLQRSLFALCPSGTGPNTIRLWEAIGCGAIPVVFSDRWRPPGPRHLWEEAVLFLPDSAEGVLSVPRLTAQWSRDQRLVEAKRKAMAELWRCYGPDGFITDLQALWKAG